MNRSELRLDDVPGLRSLLTTVIRPSTSAVDYDPMNSLVQIIEDRLLVRRHKSINLPSHLETLRIQQTTIEKKQKEITSYLTDVRISLNIRPKLDR